MSWVIRVVEWPSCSDTILMSTPASSVGAAALCRAAWNLITGRLAALASSRKRRDRCSGCSRSPSSSVNIYPKSIQAASPSRLRSVRCAVTAATLPRSRPTTRSPAFDFGLPHTIGAVGVASVGLARVGIALIRAVLVELARWLSWPSSAWPSSSCLTSVGVVLVGLAALVELTVLELAAAVVGLILVGPPRST